jgi:uncharacterized protein
MDILLVLAIGLAAGILSGLLGLGGGILMVPPIGLLAAWTYYKHGSVDIKVAALICLGFFFGGLFGAKFATLINAALLRKLFGVALLIIALKMILSK